MAKRGKRGTKGSAMGERARTRGPRWAGSLSGATGLVAVVSCENSTPLLAVARNGQPGPQARRGWAFVEKLLIELALAEAPPPVPILVELLPSALLSPLDLAAWSVARWAASHRQLLVAFGASDLEACTVEDLHALRDRVVKLGWAAGVLNLSHLGRWADLLREQVRVVVLHPAACSAPSSSLAALCEHARTAGWLVIGSGPKDPAVLRAAARLGITGWAQRPDHTLAPACR